MISKLSDREFKEMLDSAEVNFPILLASKHYGPLMRRQGEPERLEAMRVEWRERQERARARALRREASMAES